MHGEVAHAGSVIEGCQLLKTLGEGPFGVVWLARDPKRTGPIVLKLLRSQVLSQPQGRASVSRLAASIKAYAEIEHPNICPVLRLVQQREDNAFGLASPYIDGQSLDRLQIVLATGGQREVDAKRLVRLLGWFEQLSAVLGWLHDRGVVHGNLKPTNLMLVQNTGNHVHTLKLLDLAWSAIGVAMPAPGAVTYLPPEQLAGNAPSAASDQYSLIAILHRYLTLGGRPLAVSEGIPKGLIDLVQRALQPSPAARYPSMAELGAEIGALRRLLMDDATEQQPIPAELRQPAGLPSRAVLQDLATDLMPAVPEEPARTIEQTDRIQRATRNQRSLDAKAAASRANPGRPDLATTGELEPPEPGLAGMAGPGASGRGAPDLSALGLSGPGPRALAAGDASGVRPPRSHAAEAGAPRSERSRPITVDLAGDVVHALGLRPSPGSGPSGPALGALDARLEPELDLSIQHEPELDLSSIDASDASAIAEQDAPSRGGRSGALMAAVGALALVAVAAGALFLRERVPALAASPSPAANADAGAAVVEREAQRGAAVASLPDAGERPRAPVPSQVQRDVPAPTPATAVPQRAPQPSPAVAASAPTAGPTPDRAEAAEERARVAERVEARGSSASASRRERKPRGLDEEADLAMARLAALSSGEKPAEKTHGSDKGADPVASLEVGCDEGDGGACQALGERLRVGVGTAKDVERARATLERACQFGRAEACHQAAEMWSKGEGGDRDEGKAESLDGAACRNGRKASCKAVETSSTAQRE